MRLSRSSRPLVVGLAVAFLVNVGLIGLYFWGQDGQSTLVELRNDGGAFRALTDGKQVVPGGNDQRSAAVLDVPERGTIIFVIAPPAPVLPGPSGLDSIVVTGQTAACCSGTTSTNWTSTPGKCSQGSSRSSTVC